MLVIDDEEEIRAVAKPCWSSRGFSVLPANDGDQALATVQAARRAKWIAGAARHDDAAHERRGDVSRAAQACAGRRGSILSSGYNEQDATSKFAGKGLAGFLQKPYSPADLLAKVREVLGYGTPAGSGA